uniref:Uncharacterized protein n=1 Tax=Oryzias sinensis TaxID=183150 RepID=A0A8C7ZAJ0_9TELE
QRGRISSEKGLWVVGCSTSFRRWQEFVVTELAPTHHSKENSQRSFTTHRFTVILSALTQHTHLTRLSSKLNPSAFVLMPRLCYIHLWLLRDFPEGI